jgi:hypothetical protein
MNPSGSQKKTQIALENVNVTQNEETIFTAFGLIKKRPAC